MDKDINYWEYSQLTNKINYRKKDIVHMFYGLPQVRRKYLDDNQQRNMKKKKKKKLKVGEKWIEQIINMAYLKRGCCEVWGGS